MRTLRRAVICRIAGLAALFISLQGGASAQSIDASTKELVEKLLTRIDSLEKRVAELESEKAAKTPAAPPKPAAIDAVHDHDQAAAPQNAPADASLPSFPLLKIAGFADIDFAASNLRGISGFGPQTLLLNHSGFALGQTTLHFTSLLSPRVTAFGEISFTARSDAGTGTPPAPGARAAPGPAVPR